MATQTEELKLVPMHVGGEEILAKAGDTIVVGNPAFRGLPLALVPRSYQEDVDHAVHVAQDAFQSWRKVAPRERGRIMLRIADALESAAEEIAILISTETLQDVPLQDEPPCNKLG